MRLEYRHLDALVAIEDAGSLTGAARALRTSQPHVLRQLRRIEQHVGLAVFQRTADGVRPTSAGMQLLTRARQALEAARDAGAAPGPAAVLRILHSRIVASSFLRRLQTEHPDLTPELAVASPEEAFPQLRSGGAGVYLGIHLPHAAWPPAADLTVQRVVSEPLLVLLPGGHRLADREEVELADLAGDDWITTAMPDARGMAVGECRAVGGFEPRLRYQVHDSAHLKALVRDGLGVTLASSTWSPPEGTVVRPYRGAGTSHWSVVSAPGRTPPAVVATLAELARERYSALMRARGTPPQPDA